MDNDAKCERRSDGIFRHVAQQFNEPLAPPDWQGFARTFVRNTGGSNFAHDVAGKEEPPTEGERR